MEINLIGPICSTGYGHATICILNSLIELGHKISLFPINKQNLQAHPKYHQSLKTALDNAQLPNFSAPCIKIWHQNDMTGFTGKIKIGFPIFELDRLTKIEEYHLREGCDKLFVCSSWAKDILQKNIDGYIEINVIPLGVDREIFYEQRSFRKTCTFLNCGKWEVRKGHDILIKVFNQAFEEKDDVELWMLPHNPFLTPEETKMWTDLYMSDPLSSKIKILPQQESHSQIADIMRMADVGVFPSRAEGWNMEGLEMMSCGKRIISTNYSGNTEYMNKDNCELIDINTMESAYDRKWFDGKTGNWAYLSKTYFNRLVELMRLEFERKNKYGGEVYQPSVETAKHFSWKNTAELITKALEQV